MYNGQLYWGSGRKIKKHIKKYGKENFEYQILVYGTPEYIYELEEKYVTVQLIETDEKCLNIKSGGEGIKFFTEEILSKMRGRKRTTEARKRMSESHLGKEPWNKGKKMSPEQYEKVTIWAREYWKNKPGFFTGKSHDDETKEKMRLAWQKRKKEKNGLTSGYTFLNNGQQTTLVPPEKVEEMLLNGWTKGMKKRKV